MVASKEWDWKLNTHQIWLNPSEESYYISNYWKNIGYKKLLDFGCGLGRHSIFFSKQGFDVSAFDLSEDGVKNLEEWAKNEKLKINLKISDMVKLPYDDNEFDCLFAYHVISHTDTVGIQKILNEIKRILKPNGEIYLTLCSKETWSFTQANFPRIDENTIIKTDDGPEKGIPHFYCDLDDVIHLFQHNNFDLLKIRHIDDCYFDEEKRNSKHYYILAKNKK